MFAWRCRFEPSCSQYAISAIETNGLIKGTVLAFKRICRCRKTFKKKSESIGVNWGYDPVPKLKKK